MSTLLEKIRRATGQPKYGSFRRGNNRKSTKGRYLKFIRTKKTRVPCTQESDKGFVRHKARVFERIDPITKTVLRVKSGKYYKEEFVTTMREGEPSAFHTCLVKSDSKK